jgi:hypothetical protein
MIYYNRPLATNQIPLVANISDLQATDLLLDSNGEIQVTSSGNFKTISNQEVVITNLFRRITTPLGGYERNAFKDYEYTAIDEGWSDPLLSALSAPLSPAFGAWASQRLNDVTAKDPRLTVLNVTVVSQAPVPHFQISYTLNQVPYQTSLNLPVAIDA